MPIPRKLYATTVVILLLGSSAAWSQRPLGTDVSHWQGAGINWVAVRNAGVTFAWCKATESTTFTDSTFALNQANAAAAGIPIGAYHFARPSVNPNLTGASSAESEAAYFWSVVSNYIKPDGLRMVPMLDWEDSNATVAKGFTSTMMSAWVNQWCNSVSNYARGKGLTVRPVIYTGAWISRPSSTYPGLTTAVTIWPSWIAAYPANPQPQTGGPSDTYPWPTWNFWQYADTNWSGGDADVFHGNAAQLSAYLIGTNTTPPSIVSTPSSRNADRGGSIKFTAIAAGAAPLKYQWRFNGMNIPGATTNFYSLTGIQTNNAGNYTIVVTNSHGSVTSAVAVLTVNPLFTPVFSDSFDTDSSANWTLRKSSADTRVSFAYNYSGYGIPSAPNSTGGTSKGVKFEANVSLTAIAALSLSPAGQNFGGDYRLHYDLWMNANGPFPAGGAGSTQHHTSGLGTSGNQVQWTSAAADGVWFATDGEGQATDTSATLPDWRAYVGTTLQQTNSGVWAGGIQPNIRGNGHPYYQNVFPGGQTAPIVQGQSGGLDAGTIGFAWRDVVINKTGNTVEWFIDGLRIATVTNVTLAASNIFVGYWDSFSSLSSNTNLSFGLVDNLRVEVPVRPPDITVPPADLTVTRGSNATFTVAATGRPAPAYQWRFAGTNLNGATTSSFTRFGAQPEDAGVYTVVLTNVGGAVTSTPAMLAVYVPPTISVQPLDVAVKLSSNATFTVSATGTPPPGYQWYFKNSPLDGATTSSYTRLNVQTGDVGLYAVLVTNVAGALLSSNAMLTLLPPEPSRFAAAARLPDGALQFLLTGEPGTFYWIQSSTNLLDWDDLTSLVITNGSVLFNLGTTTNDTQQFFRTRLGP